MIAHWISRHGWLGFGILVTGLVFAGSLLIYPFLQPVLAQDGSSDMARNGEMPLVLGLLLGLCLAALLYELQAQAVSAKLIALLGVLVAINAALRFIEVGIPGPGGFTPIFVLVILTGYVFGGSFGFLMGALTMLVSALITGGVGPWLPGQMFTAGLVGLCTPVCRHLLRRLKWQGKAGEIYILTGYGILWGFLYGGIMNLWTWPFLIGPTDQYWTPGAGFMDTVQRYLTYYLVTSFAWDIAAAAGNALLLLAFGRQALLALRRFHLRFTYQYRASTPESASVESSQ